MGGESYRPGVLFLAFVSTLLVVVSGNCSYDSVYYTDTLLLPHGNHVCPWICECEVCKHYVSVDCEHRNLAALPSNLSVFTGSISLRGNRFDVLAPGFLAEMKSSMHFKSLDLQECSIVKIQDRAFFGAEHLMSINLDHNQISMIDNGTFDGLPHLHYLSLRGNELRHVHGNTFSSLPSLMQLDLSENLILEINGFPFSSMSHLYTLNLAFNQLSSIPADVFDESASNLKHLYLGSQLSLLNHSGLEYIDPTAFQHLTSVTHLDLGGNSLTSFDKGLFTNMKSLVSFRCETNDDLKTFPNLEGLSHIESITMHMTNIEALPEDLCEWTPNILDLDIAYSNLKSMATLRNCTNLHALYLEDNFLTHEAIGSKLSGLFNLLDLILSGNKLERIDDSTFYGMTNLEYLDLSSNPIREISSKAFSSLKSLTYLDLKATDFDTLPTDGLSNVEILVTKGNTELTAFPDIKHFPKLQTARLNYPHHCCLWRQFITVKDLDQHESNTYDYSGFPIYVYNNENNGVNSTVSPMYAYHSENHGFLLKDYTNGDFNESFFDHEYLLYDYPDALDAFPINRKVKCSPLPNALTPCDDLLEHWWLRLFVWLFMIVAIGANVVVLFVTLRSPQKSTHAHVLVIFLAIADFSLGLYLAFIAFVDASTRGEYAQLALEWRVSRSCEAAGFFAVFGSILSLWTLTAILLDRVLSVTVRCYTISKRRAWIAMSVGVAVAVTVAVLPLVGVSRYTDVGVCLPFDISTNAAKSYVTFLLVLPIVAISVITVSYVMVYCTYRRSGMKNAVCEMRVAFRVALLVIFNCACWLPIAVIGLLVIYGDRDHIVHASSLEGHDSGKISMFVAKVLVAIFFPINAVFDPFFYVISTPFFWRHMTGLLKKFRVRFRSGNNSNTLATTTGVETTIIDVTDPESDGQQTHTSNIPTVMVTSTSV